MINLKELFKQSSKIQKMYNLQKNNYHQKPKPSNIQTPPEVSEFIYELLKDKVPLGVPILDPCCGQGNLLVPWGQAHHPIYGIDIESNKSVDLVQDFLTWDGIYTVARAYSGNLSYKVNPGLILCNPPFNGYAPKLGSEVWLDKIIELFGKEIPIVLFAPVGFCANLTLTSQRLEKFHNGTYPPIASIITLPKNIFEGVIFHSEILIFNIRDLKSHYFLVDE